MDCQHAQESILEGLAEARPQHAPDLEMHLAGCERCRKFRDFQLDLAVQLRELIVAPPLRPGFRSSLRARIRREKVLIRPEFLPDVAHAAGCCCAIGVSVLVLPFAAGQVIVAGVAFSLAAYFVQTAIRGSIEAWEEEG